MRIEKLIVNAIKLWLMPINILYINLVSMQKPKQHPKQPRRLEQHSIMSWDVVGRMAVQGGQYREDSAHRTEGRRRGGRGRGAVIKDARVMHGKEEYAPNTEQSRRGRGAVIKDARAMHGKEEYAPNTEQSRVIQTQIIDKNVILTSNIV